MQGERIHQHAFRGLSLGHLPLDELRIPLRHKGHTVWLWLVLDAKTKLIAAAHLGPRTQASAHAMIHSLIRVLTPGCIPIFTHDGLYLYIYSLTAHFGTWIQNRASKNSSGDSPPLYSMVNSSNPFAAESWRTSNA